MKEIIIRMTLLVERLNARVQEAEQRAILLRQVLTQKELPDLRDADSVL